MGNQIGIRALSVMTLTLSACVTDSAIRKPSPSSSIQQDRPDQLAPVKLAKGECGLFVWAGQSRRFLMFSKGQNQAVMSDAGGEIPLLATKLDAEPDYHGQYPTQSFIDTRGKAYDLSFNKVATLGNSIRYSQGSWRSQDDNGWERIEAAYGLSTCIPDGNLPVEDTLSASRFDLLRPLGQGETADPVSTARMTFTPASIRKETTKVLPAVTKITRPVMPALPAPPPIKTINKPVYKTPVAKTPEPKKPDVKLANRALEPRTPEINKPIVLESAEMALPPQSPIETPKSPIVKAIIEPLPVTKNVTKIALPAKPISPLPRTPTGPYRIQLASYLDEGHAYKGWDKLSAHYPALASFEPQIVPTQIPNKGLYFRLYIGAYDSQTAAARYCETLKGEGLDCLVSLKKF